MNEKPGYFDIEKMKADYLEACCTDLRQVRDWQRFVDVRTDFRRYLVCELGEAAVQEIEKEAREILQS